MRETICVKTICGVINKNSVYSQTGHIDCIVHDRHVNKRSKCRMISTIMSRNGEISSAWWTREDISVQFSRSVMSDSLQPREPQHTRPPCPSPTPRVHPNPCPLSWWCHPTISSFSSRLQSFPASGSFPMSPMSQFFASGGKSIGASASASVLPVNIQDWFPLGWTGRISLQSKGLSESSPMPQFKSINSSALSFLYSPTLTSIHDYWNNHSFD